MSRLRSLIREIHRRSVWQVLAIYALGSWVVLQVVDVMADNVGLPSWTFPFALVLLLLGLPIVLATAFIQEGVGVRPEAAAGDAPLDTAAGVRGGLFTWRNAMFGGVGAFALWGAVSAGWMMVGGGPAGGGGGDDLRNIAVLPFEARSEGEASDAEFFAAGMHDDLLTQLAKIDSLTVISRTSVMKYADTQQSIPEIAAELGVKVILEGGVQRAGNRVRVNAQLIEAATDRHLWADTYDEELTAANVFAIQTDIARKIAAALHATLSPDASRRMDDRPTGSLEAYDLYNRARLIMDRRGTTRDGIESARALYEQALALDSTFAAAHAGLARIGLTMEALGYRPWSEVRPMTRAAAERAIALDPELSEAHAMMASVLDREGRFEEAERSVQRAIRLNPGLAGAQRTYALLLAGLNRWDEALVAARRAVALDPLSISMRVAMVQSLVFSQRTSEALQEAGRVLEMDPDNADTHYYMGIAHILDGNHRDAVALIKRSVELNPDDPYLPAGVAYAYAAGGQRDSAEVWIANAEAAGVPIKEIALVRGRLGDIHEAYRLLNLAIETNVATVRDLLADPTSDPIRADPRWADLMRRAGAGQ